MNFVLNNRHVNCPTSSSLAGLAACLRTVSHIASREMTSVASPPAASVDDEAWKCIAEPATAELHTVASAKIIALV